MKNTQLLKMFGEIDNKFLDEALGGDSEKPLKIDTSRAPVKWYRIAAPIAACLVIGAGIITMSRFINKPSPVDPPSVSNSNGVVIPQDEKGYFADYPQFRAENIPTFAFNDLLLGTIKDEDKVRATVAAAKLGEYYVCISADSVFHVENVSEPSVVYVRGLSLSLVKDGERLSYIEFPDTDRINSISSYEFDDDMSNFSFEVFDFSQAAVAAIRLHVREGYDDADCAFFGIADEKIYVLQGTGVTGAKASAFVNLNFSGSLTKNGDSLIDNDKELEFRFDLNSFDKDPNAAPHFSTNAFTLDVGDFFPYLDLDTIPLMDSADFDPAKSPVIKRARIAETSVCPHASVSAALVGENIFRLAEDGKEYMRMEKLSVIYYYETKLYAQVYLDPVDAGGGRGNFVIRAKDQLPIKSYHIALSGEERYDTPHIIVVGGEDFMRTDKPCCTFVRLNTLGGYVFDDTEPELTVLKGIYDSVNTTVSHVNTSNELFESGNSLIDYENKIEFCFFPEMFGYANPDAAHAHFKSRTLSPSEIPDVKGGYVYGVAVEHPEREAHESVRGTQDDLDRWYSFIASVKPAVIHAGGAEDYTFKLSDRNAAELFSIVKAAKPTLYSAEEDKPFVAGWPKWVVGCDSDGNALFEVQYNSVGIFVSFDDSGKLYYFNPKYSGIEKIGDYMYDPDHVYP